MYKLVAIDLDGTLLNSYGEVSEKNKEAIQKAKSKGAEIVIASGRPISSARSYAYEVGADNYIICGNGSVLYDMKNEQIIYDKFIERQKALQIIKICEENSIFFNIYTEKLTISKSLNYNILFYNNENKNVPEDKKTNIKIIDNIYKYVEENPDLQVLKITVCDESKIIFDSIIRKLREVKNVDVLDLQHMARKYIKLGTEEKKVEYYYTEITSKDVDKWGAIEKLADRFVEAGQVATFASDAHTLPKRESRMHDAYEKLEKTQGLDVANSFKQNARNIINSDNVNLNWKPLKKKKRFWIF